MKALLIAYIIISYPLMALIVWVEWKKIKKAFKKHPEVPFVLEQAWNNSQSKQNIKKALLKPSVIVAYGIVAIVLPPLLLPVFSINYLLKSFKAKKRKK